MQTLRVGVLALQGAFSKHVSLLKKLGVEALEVRKPRQLLECDALVIPGGESTTIMNGIEFINFRKTIKLFAASKPIFGTCAGLILMSTQAKDDKIQPFGLLDIEVERNGFGSQSDSFSTELPCRFSKRKSSRVSATFIRAPRIRRWGKEVQILASLGTEPVLVQQGMHLGSAFHPELTDEHVIHHYFLNLVKKNKLTV